MPLVMIGPKELRWIFQKTSSHPAARRFKTPENGDWEWIAKGRSSSGSRGFGID